MRRKLVLGVGLAALVGGTAAGQFAVDRPPAGAPKAAPAALPGGFQPAAGGPAPVVGGFQPAAPAVPSSPTPPTSPGRSEYAPLYSSPRTTGAYVPPTDGVGPASYGAPVTAAPPAPAGIRPSASFTALPFDTEIPSALGKDHPWLLKPEHGPWFILVKSYVRPSKDSKTLKDDQGLTARELAEALASEIRDAYRVQAFLFEYVSEERKADHRAIIAARQKAASEYVTQLGVIEQKAQLQGVNFLAPDNVLRVKKHDTRDQIGVLVGGFQSEADAQKALAKLKTWPSPKNELLMDGGAITKPGPDGKPVIETTRLNPYASAFVVRNPTAPGAGQAAPQRAGLDPFLVKLNEGEPYNLLKAKKGWTLTVKSFNSPKAVVNRDSDTSLMRKFGLARGGEVLAAGAEQAQALAKVIRDLRGPSVNGQPGAPLNLESFVLHTRYASLVTVGQFDGPDDPELRATQRLLGNMKFLVGGAPADGNNPFIENLLPMPIPKP